MEEGGDGSKRRSNKSLTSSFYYGYLAYFKNGKEIEAFKGNLTWCFSSAISSSQEMISLSASFRRSSLSSGIFEHG